MAKRSLIEVASARTLWKGGVLNPLVTSTGEVIVEGSFRYQRKNRKCYIPEEARRSNGTSI